VVTSSIEAIPILGARYIQGAWLGWTSLDPSEFGRAFVIARTEIELEEFLGSSVDESIGPQVRVCLLESSPFAVAFKMNHMVSDASGFKECLYFHCNIYSKLMVDPEFHPAPIRGDRSIRGVLKRFGMGAKLKCLFSQSKENNLTGGVRFPLSDSGETRPFILTRKLGRERIADLKDFAKAKAATGQDAASPGVVGALYGGVIAASAARAKNLFSVVSKPHVAR